MELTDEERRFLADQGLSSADVLDGNYMPWQAARALAKNEDKQLILAGECRKGHRLKTRSRHCAQCDSSRLAYQKRHRQSGHVYIAGSLTRKLIKVGGTTEPISERERRLRQGKVAGADDWEILESVEVSEYGKLEKTAHGLLRAFAVPTTYVKDGQTQESHEVFQCSFSRARAAIREAIDRLGLSDAKWKARNLRSERYEFGS
jgi:hypothetical protein